MSKLFLLIAALNGFLSVSLGAFAAHGLKNKLSPDMLAIWKTGVDYQFYHALALMGVAILANKITATPLNLSGWFFTAGIIIFSGSLYILTF